MHTYHNIKLENGVDAMALLVVTRSDVGAMFFPARKDCVNNNNQGGKKEISYPAQTPDFPVLASWQ